ncbi:MAG: hypothetical protein K2X87_17510 [Gemmataceae bacterium]|nr:hypothetical protein [Gemmataceae bacterium]
MAKKAADSPADFVTKALTLAAEAAGEVKLVAASGALFTLKANATDSAKQAVAEAVELCKTGTAPLVEVVRATEARGFRTEFVRLTPAGFCRLIELTPPDRVPDLTLGYAGRLAADNRERVKAAISGRTSGPGAELFSAALTALEEDDERRAGEQAARGRAAEVERHRQTLAVARKAVARLEEELAFRRAAADGLDRLVADLSAPTPRPPEPPPPRAERPDAPAVGLPAFPAEPTEADADFRREVAKRLATVWQQQLRLDKAEGARALEVLLAGLAGVERVGAAGDEVAFDPLRHEARRVVSAGDAVRVSRPGWVLQEGHGPHLLLKAVVD